MRGAGDVWGPPELVGLRLTSTVCLERELGKQGPCGTKAGRAAGRRLTESPLCLGHAPDRKSYTQAGRCCHLVDRSGMLRPRIGSEDLAPSGGLVLSA